MDISGLATAFLASLLGGSVGVALLDWWRTSRSERRQQQIEFLDGQIRELYGPLYYLTAQSERLFGLYDKIHQAYKAEYIEPKFSRDENTRRVLDQETQKTLDIGNEYITLVQRNVNRIDDILREKSSLMDPEDIEVFLLFFEHKARRDTEISPEGTLTTPSRIYQHLGDISFLRPEVIKSVRDKFTEKTNRLKQMRGL